MTETRPDMETKRLPLESLDIKFSSAGMAFSGYASVFGGVDSYGDTIDPKAYDRTLKNRNRDRPIRMRWNHYGPIIGKWIEMRADEKGLFVSGELTPGHSVAEDVYASMKHGAVDGMSIGYVPKKIEMLADDRRLLKEIHLVEVSIVEEPADLGAKIGDVKSILEACGTLKEIESLLRDTGGFSRTDATALVSSVKRIALGDRGAKEKHAADELMSVFSRDYFTSGASNHGTHGNQSSA
jgi:HK97 family phage prohead protease